MKRYVKSSKHDDEQINAPMSITSAQKTGVDEIKTKIWNAASAKMEDMGFPVDEIPDYLFVEVKQSDDRIRVEVRAELTYSDLTKLTNELDPIIQSFDKDAYFEPVEPGIAVAYIWNISGITSATIKASVTFSDYILDSNSILHSTSELLKDYKTTTPTKFICPKDEYPLVELNNEYGQHILQCVHCQAQYGYEDDDPETLVDLDSTFVNTSTNIKASSQSYDVYDSDDALWDVIDDEEFEFRGVQDVGYDNDGNIMVIFNHAINEDMIELLAEELLAAFRQYGYPVHDWNTNGSNVYILTP